MGLVGAPNARELGGLTAGDGCRVRPGVLVRAGALGHLTDPDLPALGRLGLACIIDLRGDPEIGLVPPDRLPQPPPPLVRAPVYDPAYPAFTQVTALLEGGAAGGPATVDAGEAMQAIYRWFVSGETARAGFTRAVRAVADPANLPVLFHCSAGKDRTGWLAVILLTILGVDPDTIRADYLLTNAAVADLHRTLLATLVARRPDLDVVALSPLLEARDAYLNAAYAEVERGYGSFDGYLREGLGLADGVLAALRTRLRT